MGSRIPLLGAIIAIVCLSLAAILLISPEADNRLALFLGIVGLVIPQLLGLLKADQAASNTNGKLDARIQAAVHRANDARRRGDRPLTADEVDHSTSPIEPDTGAH